MWMQPPIQSMSHHREEGYKMEEKAARDSKEDDYVFVVTKEDEKEDSRNSTSSLVLVEGGDSMTPTVFSVESLIEEAPSSIPYLPLDASTEITKHGGYHEAIFSAQQYLDSRLSLYSQYRRGMANDEAETLPRTADTDTLRTTALLTPRRESSSTFATPPSAGWKEIRNIDEQSRTLLRQLETDGITYTPHNTTYSVSYLSPVAPFGDCLFLSIQALLANESKSISPSEIRSVALQHFLSHYHSCSSNEKQKIDSTIKNLYFPNLVGGWGVSRVQARRYVASNRDGLLAQVYALQERGLTWDAAAEAVYSKHATPVINAESYVRYMNVGSKKQDDFLVTFHYIETGLLSIDNDPDSSRVAWGDDIALESLASAYERDIFVVLVGSSKMFFLPHRPRNNSSVSSSEKQPRGRLSPWFLLMRLTGSDRGGDHYEPMTCTRIDGETSPALGSIGE